MRTVREYKVVTRGGPFQAEVKCTDGSDIFIHYKHDILSVSLLGYNNRWVKTPIWGSDCILICELGRPDSTLDSGRLSDEELFAATSVVLDWSWIKRDKGEIEHGTG